MGNVVPSARLYALQNSTYSVHALINDAGAAVERYDYTPYGEVTVLTPAGTPIPASLFGKVYTFTGRELDAESGLLHFRARTYSPKLGRFIQRDRQFRDGMNLYELARSRATVARDPSGRAISYDRTSWDDNQLWDLLFAKLGIGVDRLRQFGYPFGARGYGQIAVSLPDYREDELFEWWQNAALAGISPDVVIALADPRFQYRVRIDGTTVSINSVGRQLGMSVGPVATFNAALSKIRRAAPAEATDPRYLAETIASAAVAGADELSDAEIIDRLKLEGLERVAVGKAMLKESGGAAAGSFAGPASVLGVITFEIATYGELWATLARHWQGVALAAGTTAASITMVKYHKGWWRVTATKSSKGSQIEVVKVDRPGATGRVESRRLVSSPEEAAYVIAGLRTRSDAFKLALQRAKVASSAQPISQGTYTGRDSTGANVTQGRWYRYKDAKGEDIYIIEHSGTKDQLPHFHVARNQPGGAKPVHDGGNYKLVPRDEFPAGDDLGDHIYYD
jgi:RHS repeat-associated protein